MRHQLPQRSAPCGIVAWLVAVATIQPCSGHLCRSDYAFQYFPLHDSFLFAADESIAFLDPPVVGQDISRSLDVTAALPRITLTNSSSSITGTTFRQQNSVQNVQLFGDEDVFMCGKCKQQFIDLHVSTFTTFR